MRYRVISGVTSSRDGTKRLVIKWILYSAALLFAYILSRAGIFGFWQPVLLIPLATAVAMREQELSSCVFALFCGLYIDIAFDFLFGFSAFWLICACLFISILSRNLVQVNFLNFCWLTACTVFLEFFMDYIFNILIWDISNSELILIHSIIPTAAATFALSPLAYLLVKTIYRKFSIQNASGRYEPSAESTEENEEGRT